MTQIVVTLENDADSTLLQRMIENMKGVIKTSIRHMHPSTKTVEDDAWLKQLHELKESIDTSIIDSDDERTQYILSK